MNLLSSTELAELPLERALGDGATSEVFFSRSLKGRSLAIKVAAAEHEHVVFSEARKLALLGGGGIPRLRGVARDREGRIRLAMDLVEGQTLAASIATGTLERERSAAALLQQIGSCLSGLHAIGWAHGDIKPENVVGVPGGGFQIVDLGLSTDRCEIVGGTPHYLPHRDDRGIVPPHADVFALCLVVAEILVPDIAVRGVSEESLSTLPSAFRQVLTPVLKGRGRTPFSMAWVLDEAVAHGLFDRSALDSHASLRLQYLASRQQELIRLDPHFRCEPEAQARQWCGDFVRAVHLIREIEGIGSGKLESELSNLSGEERSRLLGRVVGPWALLWSLPACGDAELLQALESVSHKRALRALTVAELRAALGANLVAAEASEKKLRSSSTLQLALGISARPVSHGALREVLRRDDAEEELCLESARLARLAGEYSLANALLERCASPDSELERARLGARQGEAHDWDHYEARLSGESLSSEQQSRWLAWRARKLIDAREFSRALELMENGPLSDALLETRALAFTLLGEFDAALATIEEAEGWTGNDESRARVFGVRGMLEHARGQPERAHRYFEQAVASSAASGAALEEATYATGLAASCSDAGRSDKALAASMRAEALFDSLRLPGSAARALLSRASVLVSWGATAEAASVIARGLSFAEATGDERCRAYFLMSRVDNSSSTGSSGRSDAELSRRLVAGGTTDDQLRAETRVLRSTGEVPEGGDRLADEASQFEAKLEWWMARAELLEKVSSHGGQASALFSAAANVLARISETTAGHTGLNLLGPAFVAGAHLALRVGQVSTAQDFLVQARREARVFLSRIPTHYLEGARGLSWVEQASGRGDTEAGEGSQLADVERLLRALGQRSGFRALLNQVLDMLLLWTGVERGLLLLTAPGEKLVVRAARNIEREDLSSEQRMVSLSMARRAVEEGRAIVSADAMHDATDVHRSIHALHLRSVLALPLRARGRILGVAYLDDRSRRGAFGEKELSWASLIGTVAALAISDERDRLELRRVARRAQRAEDRLVRALGSKEAELEQAERALEVARAVEGLRGDYSAIIHQSPQMRTLLRTVDRVAHSDVPFVIYGESGTGKELIFRAVARSGSRKTGPVIAENCGAVPESLLESTLFGHKKGAFTGAIRDQEGLFGLADKGTLLLDEIGEMSLAMQTKLLRVLQEGEVRPLGAERAHRVDVRLIVATHRDLKQMVGEGTFREDLYYRLNVVEVKIPALRERPEDIAPLAHHFLAVHSGGDERSISRGALARMSAFSWPGNVRQLENEVRRMLVLGGQELGVGDLSEEILSSTPDGPEARTLREKVDALERTLVIEALGDSGGNRTKAAEKLGLSRFGLQKMTQRLEIEVPKRASKSGRSGARGLHD